MCKKIYLDKEHLYDLYWNRGLSQKAVAKIFGCSVDTVARNLIDYGIPSHPIGYKHTIQKVFLSDYQRDILYGALLGDGCICGHPRGRNYQFVYTSKSKQHVDYVCAPFLDFGVREGIKYTSVYDKRTCKTYSRYTFRTMYDILFTEEYHRWYVDGVKHIPANLVLNPTICLIWYIGDGCLCNGRASQHIKLSTHCFNLSELQNIILPQLHAFEPSLVHCGEGKDGRDQYFVYIPHKHIQEFLSYIGQCPFDDYLYKWGYRTYARSVPVNHTDLESTFCKMYLEGISYYHIAKQCNVSPNVVKYYLVKRGIYKSKYKDRTKHALICYSDGVPICIYLSASAASSALGISVTTLHGRIHRGTIIGGISWKYYRNLSVDERNVLDNIVGEFFNEDSAVLEMPILKGDDRNYVDQYIFVGE